MNCNCTVTWLSEMWLYNLEELIDNLLRWIGTIYEEEVIVRDASINEMRSIIFDIIEADHLIYTYVIENINILFRMLAVPVLGVPILYRTHKCYEFTWNDPVEVAVLDTFVVFIFFDIECPEVVPAKSYTVFESLEAVKEGTIVEALTLGGISVVLEHAVVWLELLVGLLSGHLEDNDHESSHEESSIDHPVAWSTRTAVVEYPVLRVVLVSKESCQLS